MDSEQNRIALGSIAFDFVRFNWSGGHFTLLMVSKVAQLQLRTKIFIVVFRFHNHKNRLLSFYTLPGIDLTCIRPVQLTLIEELGER